MSAANGKRSEPSGRFAVTQAARESQDHHPGWTVTDLGTYQSISNLSITELEDLALTIKDALR